VQQNEIIRVLSKFRQVDKYEAFREILPSVALTAESHKTVVAALLDDCATHLLQLFEAPKKPPKLLLRQPLIACMDALSIADIDAENREFGYQLGWYLAEKVNINLGKGTEKKLWGYWRIEDNEVKMPVRPRISQKTKEQARNKQGKDTHKEAAMPV